MKKFLKILFISLLCCNVVFAAGKYTGKGELRISDWLIDYFMTYLRTPPGQLPLVFLVGQDSTSGEAIYATYWYCPSGNCSITAKAEKIKTCERDAKKMEPNVKDIKCSIFARRKTIIWDNGINPGKGKVSAVSSKWSKQELKAKLKELGFYGNVTTTKKKEKKIEKKKEKKTTEKSSDDNLVIKLEKLKKLFDSGALTEEEYKKAKEKLLN